MQKTLINAKHISEVSINNRTIIIYMGMDDIPETYDFRTAERAEAIFNDITAALSFATASKAIIISEEDLKE